MRAGSFAARDAVFQRLELDMNRPFRNRHYEPLVDDEAAEVAVIYNQAGAGYLAYADGDPDHLFSFDGPHAFADRRLWQTLEAELLALRETGARSISMLDAGCGPGTWLRRLVIRAKLLGFTSIKARGFDIAETQIEAARRLSQDLARQPGVELSFEVGRLGEPLPEADRSVDLTLCLYSVLSHLPVAELPGIAAEFARVTRGEVIVTVRSIGSTPTIFVGSLDQARSLKYDHAGNRCDVELESGRRFSVGFHLFGACELRRLFERDFLAEDLRGLDLFHTRFLPDSRWNPAELAIHGDLLDELGRLEEAHSREPEFMERATHLLFVGRRRNAVGRA
jgi:SAM-dependent methyltransferase